MSGSLKIHFLGTGSIVPNMVLILLALRTSSLPIFIRIIRATWFRSCSNYGIYPCRKTIRFGYGDRGGF